MHTITVVAVDDVIAFDLATPIEIFGRAVDAAGNPAYDVVVAGPRRSVSAGPMRISVPHSLDRVRSSDTVIVPGRSNPEAPFDARTAAAIRSAAARGARIASICVGAFDLAATGLLDGLRATTHWRAAGRLAELHPTVTVEQSALFVDNGQVLCSAGAAAGLDLCLHMIARDHGGAVAAEAARSAVMPLTRDAGQAQFIRDDRLGSTGLHAVLHWIEEQSSQQISISDIARTASVSVRTLNRRFEHELGTTPSRWLSRARVRNSQRLLETTSWSVERIALEAGLGTASNLRARFTEVTGTSPSRYRRALTSRSVHVGLPEAHRG